MSKPQPITLDAEKLRAENPDVIIVDIDLDDAPFAFAFNRPKRAHIDMATSGHSAKFSKNLNNMVLACLLAPSREEAMAIFEYYPAAMLTLGNKLLDAVGLKDADIRRP